MNLSKMKSVSHGAIHLISPDFHFLLTNLTKEIVMKKLLIAVTAATFVLTGCNTVKGFGKDVSKAGDAVTDGAQKVEKKIKQ